MKLKINMEVEINSAAWCGNYDTEPEEVKTDVQTYLEDVVDDWLAQRGLGHVTDGLPSGR